jgi:hypothetical protein
VNSRLLVNAILGKFSEIKKIDELKKGYKYVWERGEEGRAEGRRQRAEAALCGRRRDGEGSGQGGRGRKSGNSNNSTG